MSFFVQSQRRGCKVQGCSRVVRLLRDLVSGELQAARQRRVEEHLRGCPACAAVEQSSRAVIDLARRLTPLPPPEGMLLRLRQRVKAAGVDLRGAVGAGP